MFSARRILAVALIPVLVRSLPAQEVRFARDYAAARVEALEKHRPIVVVLGTENCVWCRKLESTTLRDPGIVQTLTERFVVVHIEADRDPTIANALGISGYPAIVFANPEGKILGKHEGYVDASRFRQQLDRAIKESGPAAPAAVAAIGPATPPSSGDAGRLLTLATEDLRAGQLLGCLERCRRIAATYPDAPEASEAKRLIAEIAADARAQKALTDMLCELYLARADKALAQGHAQEAADLLERIRQINPNSALVQAAQTRLAQLRSTEPRIRAQAP